MKRCNKCKLEVNTARKTCPLCFTALEEIEKQDYTNYIPLYPEYHKKPQKRNILLRLFSFLSVVAILISTIVNYFTLANNNWWCIYVIVGSIFVLVLLRWLIFSKSNIGKKIIIQSYALSIAVWIINYISNYNIKWSLDYVIPGLSITSGIVIMIFFWTKTIKFSQYISYMFGQLMLGLLPFVLWLFGLADVLWGCLSALCVSVVLFLSMIFFTSTEMKEELKKRLHI